MSASGGGRAIAMVKMADDEDWLMRPVMHGLCRYESLRDGSLTLDDVSRMNEALDVQQENQLRQQENG